MGGKCFSNLFFFEIDVHLFHECLLRRVWADPTDQNAYQFPSQPFFWCDKIKSQPTAICHHTRHRLALTSFHSTIDDWPAPPTTQCLRYYRINRSPQTISFVLLCIEWKKEREKERKEAFHPSLLVIFIRITFLALEMPFLYGLHTFQFFHFRLLANPNASTAMQKSHRNHKAIKCQ